MKSPLTINSEFMNQSNPLQILQSLVPSSISVPFSMPEPTTQISVGQIRSVTFENLEQEMDLRFVVVTSIPSERSMILQVMLIGKEPNLSGRNDVLLLDSERPSLFDTMIQTELKFPVLRSDLGALYSVLEPPTLELLANMNNYSGRDISRIGVHRNDADVIRQDYLRDELHIVRRISANAFNMMQGPEYKAEQVVLLNLPNHELTLRELKVSSRIYKPRPLSASHGNNEASFNEELEFLRQLKNARALKEKVAA
jgi:hypothetical protein